MPELYDFREDFKSGKIEDNNIPENPYYFFETWLNIAVDKKLSDPNAMILSTCTNNKPSSRVVLLKSYDNGGFVFFTNYKSKKGIEIEVNPNAALLFYWPILQKQIRIEGVISKTTSQISDHYYYQRPTDSQISAYISPQSEKITSREFLEKKFETEKNNINPTKRPDFWGGYILHPNYFEFWQGRPGRLHDRIAYTKSENNWKTDRLAP